VRRTADDRTAEEDDAVHMIGQFASDLANDHPAQLQPTRPTGPCSVATSQRLRRAVSVALRMATVDPEAPASRVVSEPAQVRAQRRRSPVAGPEPRYHYHYPAVPSRSCDEPARPPRETRRFTQGADLTKRRGGRWAVREFDSRKRDHGWSLRLMLFGVGAPDAQGEAGAADGVSAARWLRRNGRPVALARRPWVHRCRCATRRPAAVAWPRIGPLVRGSEVRRRECRRRRSAARR
jgi:hypothetical protein